VIARGRGVVEQDGRRARLGPGDLALMDLSRPARWSMSSVECVALVFPPALLPLPAERVAASTAVRIPGDGAGALPSWVARQLAGHLDRPDGARLGSAVLDLLAVALAERLEPRHEPPPETRERALLLNVRAFIEQRLDDPALSPSTIAAAHHVSVRYLHKLFETQQTTVAAWVRQRRLERCRRDLLDPALRAWSVSAIGARWGILNAGHFSRLFRAAYGVSPREYRRLGVS
jgi:AraC-like DNA-binding protein